MNLKIRPIDLSLKEKFITYCHELSLGIISFSSYVNIETLNIISSDGKMYEHLAHNSNNIFYCCLNN